MQTLLKQHPIRRRWLSAVLAMTMLLSACGGGGGGGSAPSISPTPTPPSLPKAWAGAALIETNNLGDANIPQIAMNASGVAMAVWTQSDGIRDNIWANRYTPSSGWGTATMIETINAGDADVPQIAIDANGNALAVWQQEDGISSTNIWANRYTPAGGWGTAAVIVADLVNEAFAPQIAMEANGNALAVWYQRDGTRFNILANRFTPTGGWGTATLIETDNTGAAIAPQIAFDASGNALAVWRQNDGTRHNAWANRFTPAGGWGTATLIETNNSGNAYNVQIAMNASGNAMAVWSQFSGSVQDNIWANRYTPGTGWGTAELLEGLSADASNPQIALDANGNAIAVWIQLDGIRWSIWASRFTPADGWGAAALIETDNTGLAYWPQIAFDASGNAMAVWSQDDGTANNIWARPFTPSGGWGTATLLETNTFNSAALPQIAFDANGNAVAVWIQTDGTRSNIWANVYR
jgi:hypothetical protein